jgi:CRISPR-associated protein Cas1
MTAIERILKKKPIPSRKERFKVRLAFILSEEANTTKTKTLKIILDSYGSYLGREKGAFVIKKEGKVIKRYPLFEKEISEIRVKSGNTISSGALATCGFWHIDCLILTRWNNPIAYVKSLVDDSHVETRICQYEALKSNKWLEIAKAIVLAKMKGENEVLKKYGLRRLDFSYSQQIKAVTVSSRKDGRWSFTDAVEARRTRNKLLGYEGKFSEQYFQQILSLFSESFRPERRKTYKAYDALNNVLNLAYETLNWKVQIALLKAKLEPYLGFLHHVQYGLPSLICDFMEIYRYLIDDFVIAYARNIKNRDFVLKMDAYANRKDRRQFLNDRKRRDFLNSLEKYFEASVEVPRIRRGRRSELETLINEEALLFAEYLRDEKQSWTPRLVELR